VPSPSGPAIASGPIVSMRPRQTPRSMARSAVEDRRFRPGRNMRGRPQAARAAGPGAQQLAHVPGVDEILQPACRASGPGLVRRPALNRDRRGVRERPPRPRSRKPKNGEPAGGRGRPSDPVPLPGRCAAARPAASWRAREPRTAAAKSMAYRTSRPDATEPPVAAFIRSRRNPGEPGAAARAVDDSQPRCD